MATAERSEAEWPRCALDRCRRPFMPGTGRGPGGTICSRSGCRREVYGKSAKDKQIDELRARLTEKDALIASQAELIGMLRQQLSQASQSQLPAVEPQKTPPPATRGGDGAVCGRRVPLQQSDGNRAAAAPPPAKRAKPSAPAMPPPPAPTTERAQEPQQAAVRPPPATQSTKKLSDQELSALVLPLFERHHMRSVRCVCDATGLTLDELRPRLSQLEIMTDIMGTDSDRTYGSETHFRDYATPKGRKRRRIEVWPTTEADADALCVEPCM